MKQYIWSAEASIDANNGFIIGLDFGTTNSCVSIWSHAQKRPKVIKTLRGSKLVKSIVSFNGVAFDPTVGTYDSNESHNVHAISGVKSLLSTNKTEVECFNERGETKSFPVETIIGYILMNLYHYSLSYIQKNIRKLQIIETKNERTKKPSLLVPARIQGVVIGIPVLFGSTQIAALERAAHFAGFEKVRL